MVDRPPSPDGSTGGATGHEWYTDPAGDAANSSSSQRLWPFILAALVALILAGAIVGFAVSRVGRGSTAGPGDARPDEIRLEPVTYRSNDPFTESVVTLDDDELATAAGAASSDFAGRVSGATERLYGSRRAVPPCDVGRLVEVLTGDDSVTDAFVDVIGVEPVEVARYVRSLTPVLLRADTAVTNHAYRDGRAVPFRAVLQAGTPVLIDGSGVPRVKCSCGNPLAAPDWDVVASAGASDKRSGAGSGPRFAGDGWESFDPSSVVEVEAAEDPAPRITTVDFDSGDDDSVSLGGVVALDGVVVATPDGVVVVGDDDSVTTVLNERVSAVFDDGRGGLVYTLARPDYPRDQWPSDPPTDPAHGAIWYLAPGSTEAVDLTAGHTADVWYHLWSIGRVGDSTYVVYEEMKRAVGIYGERYAAGVLTVRDLDSGEIVYTDDGRSEDGAVLWASIGGDRIAYGTAADEVFSGLVLLDESITRVSTGCVDGGGPSIRPEMLCPWSAALDEDGQMVESAYRPALEDSPTGPSELWTVDPVSNEISEKWNLDRGSFTADYGTVDQVRDGFAVVTGWGGNAKRTAGLFELSSGRMRALPADVSTEVWSMWILGSPLLRPVVRVDDGGDGARDEATAKTEQVSATWDDIKNAEIPPMCRHDATRLVDGVDVGLDENQGYFELLQELSNGEPGLLQNVPSEIGPLTAVAVTCNAGGVGWPNDLMFFAPDATVYGVLYDDEDLNWDRLTFEPGRDGFRAMRLVGDEVEVTTEAIVGDDASCCPSGMGTIRLRAENGRIVVTDSRLF